MAIRMRLSELDALARQAGFADYPTMLHELYVIKRLSLMEVGERCHISYKRVKRHLKRFNIPVHKRGGPNNVKVTLTPELLQEIMRDGVVSVAQRLGVDQIALQMKLKKLSEE